MLVDGRLSSCQKQVNPNKKEFTATLESLDKVSGRVNIILLVLFSVCLLVLEKSEQTSYEFPYVENEHCTKQTKILEGMQKRMHIFNVHWE